MTVLSETVPCNLCGADAFRLIYPSTLDGLDAFPDQSHFRCTSSGYGLHQQIVQCKRCGLVYANPRYSADAIAASYAEVEDPVYEIERDQRLLTFRKNLQPLEAYVPANGKRRLIDVGCHTGALLQVAHAQGWEAWGVEPSKWAAERAAEHGTCVLNKTLREANLPDAFFDAVTLWDVVEHLTDPRGDLAEMARIVKPGGVIAIHTIDIDSRLSKLMRGRWPWLMVMHLYYFSPRTLAKMLTTVSLVTDRVVYQGRYLSLGYLATRVRPYSRIAANAMQAVIDRGRLQNLPLSINWGDLFTLFAVKPR